MFGHEDKITAFKKLAKNGTLGHAYLFFGDREIGKFLFASSLANYLERGKWEDTGGTLSDAFFVVPKEGKQSIGIDEIKDAAHFLWQTPAHSSRKMVIIDNADLLTSEAQSAMLKIVEEPPSHAIIIFIASDSSSLFSPLLSRLVKIYFPRFSKKEIGDILEKNFGISKIKSSSVAEDSYGRIGRAIFLLGSAGGEKSEKINSKSTNIENLIFRLRRADIIKNSSKIAWLLKKNFEMEKFNVNQPLQEKAITEFLCST